VVYGTDGTAMTAIADTGYHFVKWSDDSTANPRTDTNVTANVDVTATFAINTYTLTYNLGTGGHLTGTTPQTVNHGADGATVTAVANTGYHFVKWSDDVLTASRTDHNIIADLTVTAQFTHDTFTLDYAAGANGHLTGTTHQPGVVYGTDGTAVTAVPDTGYHFVKWSDDSTANPRTDTSVTANVDVTATFAINTYAVSASAPGGHGTITPASVDVNHGSPSGDFTISPFTGYHLASLTDNGANVTGSVVAGKYSIASVTQGHTLVATFAINTYTLTYNVGTGGHVTGTTPQTVNHGADGTAVTAVAETGYHFVKWSDDVTTNPRTDTNITADLTVTAEFAHDTFTLDYAAGANGHLTGTTHQPSVVYGTDGTAVTAIADTGYHFVKWSDDSTANPRTDTNVTANVDVTAAFAINTYTVSASAPGGHGTITPVLVSNINHGSPSGDFTISPATGYHLVSLTDNGADVFGSVVNGKYSIASVTQDHTLVATFAVSTYTITLKNGWNLVAAGPGTTFPSILWRWLGNGYESTSNSEAWKGYWCRVDAEHSVDIQTSVLPQTITLAEGWNLIGNSSAYAAAIQLPSGLVAGVYDPVTGYQSLTTLQPGQGAWVKATAAGQQAILDLPASPGV
jgi:uncharacterized repeat protein (TIGR02543 family)